MVVPSLVYEEQAPIVARTMLAADAYMLAADPSDPSTWLRWKSDIRAPVYTDCRRLFRDPGAAEIVTHALCSMIRVSFGEFDYIVGTAEAGVMWSTRVARHIGKPDAFVRKQRKAHGTGTLVECSPEPGSRALVIDDLMASGSSVEAAIKALAADADIATVGVATVVNWDFPDMRERFARIGVPYRALVSYDQLLVAAVNQGRLSVVAAKELSRFYKSPKTHQWDLAAFECERKMA
jgi:orotate phosphoribosyltransferase